MCSLWVVCFFCLWAWSVVAHIRAFNLEQFGEEMAKRADRSWPIICEELDKLVKTVIPVAEKALEKEVKNSAQDISQKFNEEDKILEASVRAEVNSAVQRYLMLEGRQGVLDELKEAFPSLSELKSEKLASALQEEFILTAQRKIL